MSRATKPLSGLSDEVKELHPLLDKLLRKLPQVLEVEYTHGQDEMGADFVLKKSDATLGTDDYVGVIAKVGKIFQDFSGVERQIDECKTRRYFGNGKTEIFIREVWVVATAHITHGAQRKINDKFKDRKIVFIDGDRLTELIDKHYGDYWDFIDLDVGEYLGAIRKTVSEEDRRLSLLDPSLPDFYIDQEVRPWKPLSYKGASRPPELRRLIDVVKKDRFVLLEGGMGSGKSKMVRHLVTELTGPEGFQEHKLIPILCSYSHFADEMKGDPERAINALPVGLKEKSACDGILLIVDGLDEKNQKPDVLISALTSVAQVVQRVTNLRVLLTSRPLSSMEHAAEVPDLVRYELPPLTLQRTISFIEAICSQLKVSARITEELKRSQLFKQLPRSPIAAILLGKLLRENSKDLPSNLSGLYEKYLELVLGRWDLDKGLKAQKEYEALANILTEISHYMISHEIPCLSRDEVLLRTKAYLDDRNLQITAENVLDILFRRCELLAVNTTTQTVAFRHRTFAEFFCAKYHLTHNDSSICERALDLYWMNTVFFYVGVQRDCPEALRSILDRLPQNEGERWMRVINVGQYLLAGYATPYQIALEGVLRIAREAGSLCRDIVEKRIASPFDFLTAMQLLYLMRSLWREFFSYEYFKRALLEAAETVYSDPGREDNTTYYALYFLNVAYTALDDTQPLDQLLKAGVSDLPLEVSLALSHEFKNAKQRNTLMKKQNQQLKKTVLHNPALKPAIDRLFNRPIRNPSLRQIARLQ